MGAWVARGLGDVFGGHGADVGGVILCAVGVVCGLAIYADLAGPSGAALDDGLAAAVGLARVVGPPTLVAAGILLIRGSETEGSTAARLVVGGALAVVAVCGLVHLARGAPPLDGPVADLADAGGFVGAAVGGSLQSALAAWGAVLVLLTVLLLSLVLLTRVPLRVAADRNRRSPVRGDRGSDCLHPSPLAARVSRVRRQPAAVPRGHRVVLPAGL